jgi:hypothetical protein
MQYYDEMDSSTWNMYEDDYWGDDNSASWNNTYNDTNGWNNTYNDTGDWNNTGYGYNNTDYMMPPLSQLFVDNDGMAHNVEIYDENDMLVMEGVTLDVEAGMGS